MVSGPEVHAEAVLHIVEMIFGRLDDDAGPVVSLGGVPELPYEFIVFEERHAGNVHIVLASSGHIAAKIRHRIKRQYGFFGPGGFVHAYVPVSSDIGPVPAVHRFCPLGIAYEQRIVVNVVVYLVSLLETYDIGVQGAYYDEPRHLLLLELSRQYLQYLTAEIHEILLEFADLLSPDLIGLDVESIGGCELADFIDDIEIQPDVVGTGGIVEPDLGSVFILFEIDGHAGKQFVIKNGTFSDSVLYQDPVFIERTVRQSAGQSQRRDIDQTFFLFMYE